jgi:hypothetical protein
LTMAKRRTFAGVRFASGRPIPGGLLLRVTGIGLPDRVNLGVQLPDAPGYTDIGEVPVIQGEIVIPDERVFPSAQR